MNKPSPMLAAPLLASAGEGLEDVRYYLRRNRWAPVMDGEGHRVAFFLAVRVMGVPPPCCIALPTRFDTTCATGQRPSFRPGFPVGLSAAVPPPRARRGFRQPPPRTDC